METQKRDHVQLHWSIKEYLAIVSLIALLGGLLWNWSATTTAQAKDTKQLQETITEMKSELKEHAEGQITQDQILLRLSINDSVLAANQRDVLAILRANHIH